MNIQEIIQSLDFSNLMWQILAPIIFSLVDVLTGFIQAVINKNVDSSKMRQGLLHKVVIILVILLSFVADFTFSLNYISKVVCAYVILMETTSILENIKKTGIEIGPLTKILNIGGYENNEDK